MELFSRGFYNSIQCPVPIGLFPWRESSPTCSTILSERQNGIAMTVAVSTLVEFKMKITSLIFDKWSSFNCY